MRRTTRRLALRVDALASHALAHLQVEALDEVVGVRSRDAINGHVRRLLPREDVHEGRYPRTQPRNRGPVKVVENF